MSWTSPENHPETLSFIPDLTRWRLRSGLTVALFDLDDTLIPTVGLFRQQMGLFVRYTSEEIGVPFDQIYQSLSRINDTAYETHFVSPGRWLAVTAELDRLYNTQRSQIFTRAVSILDQIYQIPLGFHPGAAETLTAFHRAGFQNGLVTHSNLPWFERKRRWLSLDDRFDRMRVVPENGPKGSEHWSQVAKDLGGTSLKTMIIGDSVRSDMIPAAKAGFVRLFLVENPTGWRVYREGELPAGTVVVRGGIQNLLPTILSSSAKM